MDLKLRMLQFVRGVNNRQNDRVSGSLRTRPALRTVLVPRSALRAPPTTSPAPRMDSRPLRRPDRIGPPTSRQAARPIFRPPPAARVGPHSALDSRPGGPYMFRQIPNSQRRKSPRSRSRSRSLSLSFLLAALLVAISSVATAQDHSLSPEKRAQIEKAVSAFMA